MLMISFAEICEYHRLSVIVDKGWSRATQPTRSMIQERSPELYSLFSTLVTDKVIQAADDHGLLTAQFKACKLLHYCSIEQLLLILQWMIQIPTCRKEIFIAGKDIAADMLFDLNVLTLDQEENQLWEEAMNYLDDCPFVPNITKTSPLGYPPIVTKIVEYLDRTSKEDVTDIDRPLSIVLFLLQGLLFPAYTNAPDKLRQEFDRTIPGVLQFNLI